MSRQQIVERLLRWRQLWVGLAMVVMVVVIGVTFGHRHHAGTSVAPAGGTDVAPAARLAGEGTLIGAVEGCGESGSGSCQVTSVRVCAPACLTTSYVDVTAAGGGAEAKAPLHDGHFSLTVSPGRYTLALLATGRGGRSSVFQTRRVTVRRRATSDVIFRLRIP